MHGSTYANSHITCSVQTLPQITIGASLSKYLMIIECMIQQLLVLNLE